jgi:acetyl esterase/lipase
MNTRTKLHRTLQALFIAGISIFALAPARAQDPVQVTAQDPSWILQQRTLPAPAAASEALREAITKAPQPDVARNQGTTFQTNEEWVKYIRAADEAAVAAVKVLAERLQVTIKEETIAGVTVRRVTPANINPANKNRLFVHTHGGAYVVNNGRAYSRNGMRSPWRSAAHRLAAAWSWHRPTS